MNLNLFVWKIGCVEDLKLLCALSDEAHINQNDLDSLGIEDSKLKVGDLEPEAGTIIFSIKPHCSAVVLRLGLLPYTQLAVFKYLYQPSLVQVFNAMYTGYVAIAAEYRRLTGNPIVELRNAFEMDDPSVIISMLVTMNAKIMEYSAEISRLASTETSSNKPKV